MDDPRSPADADPDEPGRPPHDTDTDTHTPCAFYVPVRIGRTGGRHLRFMRTPLGHRTAVAFTTPDRLATTLGTRQTWVRLGEPALRALATPLGVTTVTVDPQLTAPAAQSAPRPLPAPWFAVTGIHSRVD
ncbi:SAV_915 family protein [Streptomyces sp. NPDC087440]|uniref:SAV_915 family protein n=1 Tax=Streptomyces sp. NPDC087440 TaxID=3365790 RepID=UPI0038287B52